MAYSVIELLALNFALNPLFSFDELSFLRSCLRRPFGLQNPCYMAFLFFSTIVLNPTKFSTNLLYLDFFRDEQ